MFKPLNEFYFVMLEAVSRLKMCHISTGSISHLYTCSYASKNGVLFRRILQQAPIGIPDFSPRVFP